MTEAIGFAMPCSQPRPTSLSISGEGPFRIPLPPAFVIKERQKEMPWI
jgi:hypothetical protein